MSRSKRTKLPPAARLESGGMAPVSGVYRLDHDSCSRDDLWLKKGQRLPLCPQCGGNAAFLLEEKVEHISEDPDFE